MVEVIGSSQVEAKSSPKVSCNSVVPIPLETTKCSHTHLVSHIR